jgi:hypothetical protein
MDANQILKTVSDLIVQAGLKIVRAIILWFVERRLISFAVKITSTILSKSGAEPTTLNYLSSGRPYSNPSSDWQVYFDSDRLRREVFIKADFPTFEQTMSFRKPAI